MVVFPDPVDLCFLLLFVLLEELAPDRSDIFTIFPLSDKLTNFVVLR